jgi:MFS family permease
MTPLPSSKSQHATGPSPSETRRALWHILVAWIFGAIFFSITSGAPVTSFLTKYLHVDDVSYGFIMAAAPAAVLLQFLGSYMVERTGRIKRPFLIFVTVHRLLWLGIAAVPLVLAHASPTVRIWTVGGLIFLSAAIANFGGAGWAAWMSRVVPRSLAGKFFGYRARAGLIAMILATSGASYLIDHYAGQGWLYVVIFGVAAVMGAIDILLFLPVHEVPPPREDTSPTLGEILAIPWRDRAFRWFAAYTALAWTGYMMAGPFIWRYCFEAPARGGLGMSTSQANFYLFLLPLLAMAWVAPFWGQALDRFGPRPVFAVSSISAIILPLGWLVMHRELIWCIPILALLGGLFWPGIEQVLFYMQVKGFPDTRRTAYNAAIASVLGVASTVGTALGGVLAAFWARHWAVLPDLPPWLTPYHGVFAVAIVLRLIAFVFIFPHLLLAGTATQGMVTRAIARDASTSVPGMDLLLKHRRRQRVGKPSPPPPAQKG